MSVESTYDRFKVLNKSIGLRSLNALFPNDVEIYIFALEVVNSDNETEDYFIFPINPSSVSEQNNPIQNIKKTAGGVTVLTSNTFSPTDTMLQGNFGRKFKFLLGKEVFSFSALKYSPLAKATFNQEFDIRVKTGYGCCKVLEKMIHKSNSLDSKGKPYALYFYNLALGNSYLVKTTGFNFYQNLETNIIWNYNLSFKSLIPIEDITDKSQHSLTQALSANSAIQDQINNIGNSIARLIF